MQVTSLDESSFVESFFVESFFVESLCNYLSISVPFFNVPCAKCTQCSLLHLGLLVITQVNFLVTVVLRLALIYHQHHLQPILSLFLP